MAFAQQMYAPHSREGRKLLAHELAHVVQQRGGEYRDRELNISAPDTDLESEASPAA